MMQLTPGQAIVVYGRWPGVFRGWYTSTEAICSYNKHGSTLVGFVPASRIKVKK